MPEDPLVDFFNQRSATQRKAANPTLRGHVSPERTGKKEVPPEEVQAAFQSRFDPENMVTKYEITKVDPSHLLLITGNVDHFSKTYFDYHRSYNYRFKKRAEAEDFTFHEVVSTHFRRRADYTYEPQGVTWEFEQEDKHYSSDEQMHIGLDKPGDTRVTLGKSKYASIYMWYVNSNLYSISLQDYHKPEIPPFYPEKVIASGGTSQFDAQGNTYIMRVDGETITLVRKNGEKVLDEITVPKTIQEEEIVETLFNEKTLADPIHASPNYDDSWKDVNLMDVLNMKWAVNRDKKRRSQAEVVQSLKDSQ